MSTNDNTTNDQVNNEAKNNVVNINQCYTTPVVDAISAAHIYVDPAVWSKIIIHPGNKKPNWLAIHLFARILYWYGRTELRHETTGKFLGFKKKFKYDRLQMSYQSIEEQMGCTYKEARSALDCLVDAKLIQKELRNLQWQGNVMFVEPIVENILCIINPEGVHIDTPLPLEGQTLCISKGRPSAPGGAESTLCSTLSSPLNSTYDSKGEQNVDNPGGLPTVLPPTNKKIDKEKRERARMFIKQATEALSANKKPPRSKK